MKLEDQYPGGWPHQSKRGDEPFDRLKASVVCDVQLYVGDVINVNGIRHRIVATTPGRPLELRPI